MAERLIEKKNKLLLCYIDCKKAFDKVKSITLSKLLAE